MKTQYLFTPLAKLLSKSTANSGQGSPEKTDCEGNGHLKVRNNTFAVIKPAQLPAGPITEVSMEGLVFQYSKIGHLKDLKELSILVPGFTRGIFLEGIPIESYTEAVIEDPRAEKDRKMCRHTIKFGKLTPAQLNMLKNFIKTYATC